MPEEPFDSHVALAFAEHVGFDDAGDFARKLERRLARRALIRRLVVVLGVMAGGAASLPALPGFAAAAGQPLAGLAPEVWTAAGLGLSLLAVLVALQEA